MIEIILKTLVKNITNRLGNTQTSQTREIVPPRIREKPAVDSFKCPYCFSTDFVRRGTRQKKLETVQLYLCKDCGKTFTPHLTKGKHYPLPIILDALAIYNLGYSLEQTCRIVNTRSKREASVAGGLPRAGSNLPLSDTCGSNATTTAKICQESILWRRVRGSNPDPCGSISVSDSPRNRAGSPSNHEVSIANKTVNLQPSTLANWLTEFKDKMPFGRMREFALKKYAPKDMVVSMTLVHRQLYRFRFHRAKADLMIQEEYQHRKFTPVKEFLEMVPSECPHHYFETEVRASETPLTFSKTQMIVRAKQNYATAIAAFILQSVKDRNQRHEAIQKFFLACDSVTIATEVPVYITRDDLLHMQTQLGFEIIGDLPKLITGHIDILQIRNGQVHILDFKPKAEKEKPIEQLTLYAMALSRLTGLRLFEFKCAWFDEKDYFEFFPLHVLHKTKGAARRRKIATKEGVYDVNLNPKKIEKVRPS